MDIKRVIKAHGYTINHVAEQMGCTRVTLSQMIVGNPTVNTLTRIADVIGANVAEFFADSSNDTPTIKCPHCGKPINIHID